MKIQQSNGNLVESLDPSRQEGFLAVVQGSDFKNWKQFTTNTFHPHITSPDTNMLT